MSDNVKNAKEELSVQKEINKTLDEREKKAQKSNQSSEEIIKNLKSQLELENKKLKLHSDDELKEERLKSIAEKTLELEQEKYKALEKQAEILQQRIDSGEKLNKKEEEQLKKYLIRLANKEKEFKLQKDINKLLDEQNQHAKELQDSMGSFAANLLGIKKTSFKETFLGKLVEGKKLGFSIPEQLKIMGKEMKEIFSVENMLAATSKKIVVSTILLAAEQESAISSFNATTGAGGKYDDMLRDMGRENIEFGINTSDAAKSLMSLRDNFVDFTRQGQDTQKELVLLGATLEKIGVSTEDFSKSIGLMTKTMGMSTSKAQQTIKEIAATSKALGVSIGKMTQDFVSAAPKLAVFGDKAGDVFRKLAVTAKNTGIEINDLLGITEQFDTFEGASESVAKLNNILGKPYLDAMKMIETTDPNERMKLLKNAIDATGKSFDKMSYYDKKAMAAAAKMDVDKMSKMMTADLDKQSAAAKEAALSQEELNQMSLAAQPIWDKLKNIVMSFAISMGPVVDGLKSIVDWLAKHKTIAQAVGIGLITLMGVFVGLNLVLTYFAVKAAFAGTAAAAAGTTMGTGLASGIAAVGTASLAAGPGLMMLGFSILMIGGAIFLAAYGISLLVNSMKGLTMENAGSILLVMGGLVASLMVMSIFAPYAAFGIGLIAASFLGLAFSLAMIKTDDLMAVSWLFDSISKISTSTASSLREVGAAIKEITKAIDDMPAGKSILISSMIDNVRRISEQGGRNIEARETIRSTISNISNVANGGGTSSGGVSSGSANGERTIILQLGDRVLKKFVIDVLNSEMSVRKIL